VLCRPMQLSRRRCPRVLAGVRGVAGGARLERRPRRRRCGTRLRTARGRRVPQHLQQDRVLSPVPRVERSVERRVLPPVDGGAVLGHGGGVLSPVCGGSTASARRRTGLAAGFRGGRRSGDGPARQRSGSAGRGGPLRSQCALFAARRRAPAQVRAAVEAGGGGDGCAGQARGNRRRRMRRASDGRPGCCLRTMGRRRLRAMRLRR
jgi:hypothetical protein